MARKSHLESTERIKTLVDEYLLIAMALLVLSLGVPQLKF